MSIPSEQAGDDETVITIEHVAEELELPDEIVTVPTFVPDVAYVLVVVAVESDKPSVPDHEYDTDPEPPETLATHVAVSAESAVTEHEAERDSAFTVFTIGITCGNKPNRNSPIMKPVTIAPILAIIFIVL